jgi:hypothetical protein
MVQSSWYEKIIGLTVFSLIIAFTGPILGCLFGAFAGWTVGLVFADAVIGFLHRCGVNTDGLTMWQLGAALGFIGGYLKTSVHQKT